MNIEHTKELGGTLLVELKDGRVYEIRRYNSGYIVLPDKGFDPPTEHERVELVGMYMESNCPLI